ncbi:EAL domain-containing protein [Aeromonas sobria]|uniref:EAL domain-containing protein n=1 Tax=Aeromonas sobria TaxID=646 RepID=UPI003D050548
MLSAALVFALPVLVGVWELHASYLRALDTQSELAAAQAVQLMEKILDHVEGANLRVMSQLNRPCQSSLFTLRRQAALVPFVRTINLIDDQGVYCNSVVGKVRWQDEPEAYSEGVLRLLPGSPELSHQPMLSLRSDSQYGSVGSTIDSTYLKILLALSAPPGGEVLLQVGEEWLDHQGQLVSGHPSLPTLAAHSARSTRYPLSIYAGMDLPSIWLSLWQGRQLTLLTLLGFSLSISLLVWLLLGRPGSMEGELKRALRAREFIPYLQPLVTSDSGTVMGAEVLMRWQHPSSGLIRPDLFIPQAEECGVIVPMTDLLMQAVARQLGRAQEMLPNGFHIGFNISAAHCRDFSLLEECRAFLAHFTPGRVVLVLELTERELLVADPRTLALFHQLDEIGVRLAIDDFGTGHSSLSYLQQFHVDYLKIDRSFIGRIGTESLSEHIVDNVIDLGHRLGMHLIAEGVETREQADYLKGKVTYLQGYLLGRPMPLRQFCDELLTEVRAAGPVI